MEVRWGSLKMLQLAHFATACLTLLQCIIIVQSLFVAVHHDRLVSSAPIAYFLFC